jgi:hypothetical protein
MATYQKITALLLVSTLLFSCGGSNNRQTANEQTNASKVPSDTTVYAADDTTRFKFNYTLANIPSPASIIHDLKLYGVPYNKSLLNETAKIPGYVEELKLAINMGVCAIDMTYAMSNRFGSDVIEFSKGVVMLSDRLGLNTAVTNMLGKRAENNMNNKDSIFQIIDEMLIKSDAYLRTNKRSEIATAIFTGSWLEAIYLNSTIYSNIKNEAMKKMARKILWEQRLHLGTLLDLLADFKPSLDSKSNLEELTKIHKLIMLAKTPEELTNEKFTEIATKINNFRVRVTN